MKGGNFFCQFPPSHWNPLFWSPWCSWRRHWPTGPQFQGLEEDKLKSFCSACTMQDPGQHLLYSEYSINFCGSSLSQRSQFHTFYLSTQTTQEHSASLTWLFFIAQHKYNSAPKSWIKTVCQNVNPNIMNSCSSCCWMELETFKQALSLINICSFWRSCVLSSCNHAHDFIWLR